MSGFIDAVAERARERPAAVLDEYPWLGSAIDDDRGARRFAAWGLSSVIDENTGGPVLDPALFAALHARAGIGASWPVGNAGLLHVYGYLLSTVPTPYGLKRERWLGGELAGAYGRGSDGFVPWSDSSSLLTRVTDAASALRSRDTVRTAAGGSLALGRPGPDGPWALVYTVDGLLVTTFPVGSVDAVLEEWDAEPDRLRWNAVRGAQYQPVALE